jgi:hypothetical protein
MDGLSRSVGDGIGSLVSTAFDTIGGTLRFIVASANEALPGGLLPLVVFSGLASLAWFLARR